MIDVRGVCKRYGATVAVDDLSFRVERGEVVGLLGPNGAGKTTTLRILTTYLPPDSGTAVVGGHDIRTDPLSVRRHIGYLPESSPLYGDMKVFEYLDYVAALRGTATPDRLGEVRKMLELCALEEVMNRDIAQLSKGFRQRVGLAQASIHEPEILILDEPTTGLDPNQIAEIRELIKNIGRKRTVILSSHILSEVQATCDRIIIIDGGKVAASGTARELADQARGGSYWLATLTVDATGAAPEAALTAISGIVNATPLATAGEGSAGEGLAGEGSPEAAGKRDYRIEVDPTDDDDDGKALGGAIFRAAIDHGWTVHELRHERASLEHVFRQLTTPDDDEAQP